MVMQNKALICALHILINQYPSNIHANKCKCVTLSLIKFKKSNIFVSQKLNVKLKSLI